MKMILQNVASDSFHMILKLIPKIKVEVIDELCSKDV